MKRKLFLLLCALLTMIGVQAGTDVTNTYLMNADFSTGTPVDNHVCTYGKDMAANNTTYYGAQAISGWTNASVGVTDQDYPNCGVAGALFTYGSSLWVAGAGTTVPAAGPSANPGNAAGLCAVWGNTIRYTQDVTLPAGHYTVKFQVYNSTTNNGSGKLITTNLFGFDADEGDDYYSPATTFAIGQWTTVTVTFTLAAETSGKISMGYVGPSGSGNMPHLFVDNVKILSNTDNTDKTSSVGLEANTYWKNASDGMQGSGYSTDDGRSAGCAARYGTSAVANDVIYQDITGLEEGNYEVEVYALSQNEWNNNGASLQNDKGDAVYVFATGTSTVKTYINARRGPGINANGGPKVYSISNVITEDGNLRLGLGIDIANQTEWHMIQIKSLKRVGSAFEALVTAYETALSDAKTMSGTSAKMSAATLTALNNAIDTYDEGKVDKSDKDALIAATNALNDAIDNASASLSVYANINTAIGNYATKAAALDASGAAAYDDSDVTTKYNNGTYATLAEAETDLKADYVAAIKAQTTAGSNWTELISNPSFETNNFSGWTNTGMATQGNNSFTLKNGSYYAEVWQPNGTKGVSQTLSAMPSGVYRLSAASFVRGITSAKIFAGDVEKAITVGADAATYSVEFACDNNANVEIGFEAVCTGAGASWICVDNFTLTLVSSGLPDVVPVVGKMNATVATAQTEAIETYEADRTIANYNAASAAIAAAQASKDAYTVANDAITKAEALQTANNFVTSGAATTFAEAIAAIKTPYTNGTLTDENATAAGRTLGVVAVGWHAEATNTPASNYIGSTWPNTYTINDWSVEGENDGSNYVVPFFQNWIADGSSLGTTTMTGTLTGLSAGIYKVSVWVRVRAKNGVAATDATGITMDVNGGTAVDVTEGTQVGETQFQLKVYEAMGIVSEDGNLTVNFNIVDGNNISWLSYKDISYTRLGDASVSVTIGAEGYATLGSQYPLDLTPENLAEGVKAYKATSVNGETIQFVALEQSVPANTGLLIAGEANQVVNIPVAASSTPVEGENLLKVNASGETFDAEVGCSYYGLLKDTKEFHPFAPAYVAIPANKAYLRVENINPARLIISFDEEEDPTAINVIEAANAKAEGLKDGKYLIGNKVVLVKNGVKYSANGQKLN